VNFETTPRNSVPTGSFVEYRPVFGIHRILLTLFILLLLSAFAAAQGTFGNVNVGTAASSQSVTFSFTTPVTLSAVEVLTGGQPNLDYTDAGGNTCVAGQSSGSSCTVNVAFTPSVPGPRSGAVVLFQQGATAPYAVSYLSGVGQSSAVTIDPGTQTTLASLANSGKASAVAVDGGGNVYVTDSVNNLVIEYVAKNSYAGTTVVSSGLTNPIAIALDGAGNLYISNTGGVNTVVEVPNEQAGLNGSASSTVSVTGLSVPAGLAVDDNGNLFVVDSSNGNVDEVPPNGGPQSTPVTGLTSPSGIAVDGNDNLYVSSSPNKVNQYPFGGGSPVPYGSGYSSPNGLAVDASGALFVADSGNSRIVRVAPGGTTQSVLPTTSISSPQGVALDSSDNVYATGGGSAYKVNRTTTVALSFPSTQYGTTNTAAVTVSDAGNQALNFSGLATTGAAAFSVVAPGPTNCTSSTSLNSGSQCPAAVQFAPTSVGTLTGALMLSDNALEASSTQTVQLSGVAIQSSQTISFSYSGDIAPPASSGYDTEFTVEATALGANGSPSGVAVVYKSSGVCSVVNNGNGTGTYTMTGPTGVCLVDVVAPATTDYASGTTTVTVNATKATPIITWSPTPISYGTPLGNSQLNATATNGLGQTVAGTFTYTPGAGKIPPAGSRTLTTTFTPTSTADYNKTTQTATLQVSPASTTTTVTSNDQTVTLGINGTALVAIDVNVSSYKPTGSVMVTATGNSDGPSCAAALTPSTGNGGCTLKFTSAGTWTIGATYGGDANHTGSNNSSQSPAVTVTVQSPE
jgi:sugar lactone lactonase YvrE